MSYVLKCVHKFSRWQARSLPTKSVIGLADISWTVMAFMTCIIFTAKAIVSVVDLLERVGIITNWHSKSWSCTKPFIYILLQSLFSHPHHHPLCKNPSPQPSMWNCFCQIQGVEVCVGWWCLSLLVLLLLECTIVDWVDEKGVKPVEVAAGLVVWFVLHWWRMGVNCYHA